MSYPSVYHRACAALVRATLDSSGACRQCARDACAACLMYYREMWRFYGVKLYQSDPVQDFRRHMAWMGTPSNPATLRRRYS